MTTCQYCGSRALMLEFNHRTLRVNKHCLRCGFVTPATEDESAKVMALRAEGVPPNLVLRRLHIHGECDCADDELIALPEELRQVMRQLAEAERSHLN